MTPYLQFKELHQQTTPLLLGNAWNAQSAKVFEELHFKAIGTSSAAIAHSLGYEDGQQLPFSEMLYIVERIKKSTHLPLTVDIEQGYGNDAGEIANNIQQLYHLGVAGINIEDSVIVNGERILKDSNEFSSLLKRIVEQLMRNKASVFINVRCDAFIVKPPDATEQSLTRIKQYEQTGADGIFLPCITTVDDIKTVVSQTKLPLNVMCMPGLPDFEVLSNLGVKRISMGNFLNGFLYKKMSNTTSNILEQQSFTSLF